MTSRALDAMRVIAGAVDAASERVEEEDVDDLVGSILEAEAVFVMGAGRSGLGAKGFAMRLMHLGLESHVVGETTTPLHGPGDLAVAISGSGETSSIVELGEIVEGSEGTDLALVTGNADSTLGGMADHVVELDGLEAAGEGVEEVSDYAPLGTLFEVTAFAFLDGVISQLMEATGQTEEDLAARHAGLE